MHYSMMMVKNNGVATTGPKYFPMEMCDDNDDEVIESGDDPNDNKVGESNLTCKCTKPIKRGTITSKSKTKKGYWGSSQ